MRKTFSFHSFGATRASEDQIEKHSANSLAGYFSPLLHRDLSGSKTAAAMNSYGYIYGLSASTGNVSEVRVYDNTSHAYLYSSGVDWGGYWGVPQGTSMVLQRHDAWA